jgi:CBS domain-containing protein
VSPEQSVGEALELMLCASVRHLPVVEGGGELVGVLTELDLLSQAVPDGPKALAKRPVRELMTTELQTVAPDTTVSDAAARMAAAHIGCLPVVEGRRLVGILTRTDILAERGRLLFKGQRAAVPSASTVMTAAPVRVHPETDVIDAVVLMVRHGVRHLPVVDGQERLVGMVSERDLRTALGSAALSMLDRRCDLDRTSVASAMTPSPIAVGADASIFDVASHLVYDRVGAVPVVDDRNRVVGIISYVDLLRYTLVPSA